MMDFHSKVVLVTGAGAGIGLETALAFAKLGAKVVLVDRDPQNGEDAVKKFNDAAYEVFLLTASVDQSEQVQKVIADVEKRWGRLDVVVNNAGIYTQGNVAQTSLEEWERLLAVNLTGAFLITKYALPLLQKSGGGVIINVASEAGLVGIKGQVAYNVTKAGMIGLTRSCAVDLAPLGIRVNSVCPGTTDTPLVQAAIKRSQNPAAAREQLEKVRPLNRLGRPEEIASAIVYLASDEAAYATGSIFSMDGGFTAQ